MGASARAGARLAAVVLTCLLGLAPAGPGAALADDSGPTLTVELAVEAPTARVSPLLPQAPHGQAVGDPARAFPQTTLRAHEGRVRLALGTDPVWVEEDGPPAAPDPAARPARPRAPFGVHPATFPGEDPPFGLARDLGLGWHRGATAWWVDIQSEEDIARGTFDFSDMDRELAALPPEMEAVVNIALPERLVNDQPRPGRRKGPGGTPGGAPGGGAGAGLGLGPPPGFTPGGPPPGAGPPGWGGGGGGGGGGGMPRPEGQWRLRHSEEAYLSFVRTMVRRYDGRQGRRVSHWQFENEPDFSRAPRDWEGFAHLQALTYQAIKEIDPQATVLMAGLTVNAQLGAYRRFFEPALARLGGGSLDVFDLHHFGPAEAWRELPEIYAQVRRGLDALGYAHAPIWMTECGTYSGQPTRGLHAFQSEREQAASLVKRLTLALNLGVAKVFWAWGVMEGFQGDDSFFDHTGLVYDGRGRGDPGRGVRKLAYHSLRRLDCLLGGQVQSLGRLELGPRVVGLAFLVDGRRVSVLWADLPVRPPAPGLARP